MKRVLLDVNVVLDVLLDRKPFADTSSEVWATVERGEAEGLLAAHAVTTLHYLNAKAVGGRQAREVRCTGHAKPQRLQGLAGARANTF